MNRFLIIITLSVYVRFSDYKIPRIGSTYIKISDTYDNTGKEFLYLK